MKRPWYTRDNLRKRLGTASLFLGLLIFIWLTARVPAIAQVYERLQAGVVRLGTGMGRGLAGLTESELSLQARYAEREAEVRALAIDQAEHQALEREVLELRGLLGYTATASSSGTPSHVIARSVDQDATRVLIDKGANDGVVRGAAVVIDTGVLFGIIDTVHDQTAEVRLVAHPDSRLPATILGGNRTLGLVEGRQGSLLTMEFIPQDSDVLVDDVVVTSGLDAGVKAGLVIGLVTEVVTVESAPFKQAFIELLYEPREWTTVLVLPPPGL